MMYQNPIPVVSAESGLRAIIDEQVLHIRNA